MKIFVAHDAQGNIEHVVINPEGAPPATVTTETGLFVTELEAPTAIAKLDLSDPKASRQVAKALAQIQTMRVEGPGKGKLTGKRK